MVGAAPGQVALALVLVPRLGFSPEMAASTNYEAVTERASWCETAEPGGDVNPAVLSAT